MYSRVAPIRTRTPVHRAKKQSTQQNTTAQDQYAVARAHRTTQQSNSMKLNQVHALQRIHSVDVKLPTLLRDPTSCECRDVAVCPDWMRGRALNFLTLISFPTSCTLRGEVRSLTSTTRLCGCGSGTSEGGAEMRGNLITQTFFAFLTKGGSHCGCLAENELG